MNLLSRTFLEELKYKTDIRDLIEGYVNLKGAGRTSKGLCPFHSEKSPSFVVYSDTQSFYCFGCSAGGDAVTFLMKLENLTYMEAVEQLCRRAGMQMPEVESDGSERLRLRIAEINRISARFFYDTLYSPLGERAMSYLKDRAVTEKMIRKFGIGYAPAGWDTLKKYLTSQGFTTEEMLAAGVIVNGRNNSQYDAFRNRVIFPIIDSRSNVLGFGGRALPPDSTPKYLNTGDTLVFKKSRELFAMGIAKKTAHPFLILAEGYMDVVAVTGAGFDCAVASLGTALTANQARMLSALQKPVILAFDSDEAGRRASARAATLLEEAGVDVRVLTMEGAKDPDEYIRRYGAVKFKLLLEESPGALAHEIAMLRKKHDLTANEGIAAYVSEFCTVIARVGNPVLAEVYTAKMAEEFSLSRTALDKQIASRRKQLYSRDRYREERSLLSGNGGINIKGRSENIRYALAEDSIITALLKNTDLLRDIVSALDGNELVTDMGREVLSILRERIEQNLPLEMFYLSSVLTEQQMSYISFLQAKETPTATDKLSVSQYIDTINSYHNKRSDAEVALMAEDELQSYIETLSAKKNRGSLHGDQ